MGKLLVTEFEVRRVLADIDRLRVEIEALKVGDCIFQGFMVAQREMLIAEHEKRICESADLFKRPRPGKLRLVK